MLVKVTNTCGRGCSHCMEGSLPGTGLHMTRETFIQMLKFVWEIEALAREACGYNLLLFSGGECTEHPDIVKMISLAGQVGFQPFLITNGLWLADPVKKAEILDQFPRLMVQVTYDPRFYPEPAPPKIDDPRIFYENKIRGMMPLGRFKNKKHDEVPTLRAPGSFNFRSTSRNFQDVRMGIAMLRTRAVAGMGNGHCSPSISYDGSFVAGETNYCWKLGTVQHSIAEINAAMREMRSCNRCGLEKNLTQPEKRAIGLSTLYVPGESG